MSENLCSYSRPAKWNAISNPADDNQPKSSQWEAQRENKGTWLGRKIRKLNTENESYSGPAEYSISMEGNIEQVLEYDKESSFH